MRAILFCLFSLNLAVSDVVHGNDIEQQVSLPRAGFKGQMSVEEAIKKRRSVREFGRGSLALEDVSQLLWAAQGMTGGGSRAVPSAGALYPLEIYVVAGNVEGLSPGVYRYRSRNHKLLRVASGERRKSLASAALGQSWVRRAPMVLVIASVYERTTEKYGQRGRRYVHIEVGHAAQNIYLQAAALGLATVLVGAFHDSEVQGALDLPSDHEPLGLMPVGYER